jgi:hypothetical protein
MLFGGILLAVGGLIALLTGLCSAYFMVLFISDSGGSAMLPLVLLIGGIPFAIGLGLFFWGRSLVRSAREDQRD